MENSLCFRFVAVVVLGRDLVTDGTVQVVFSTDRFESEREELMHAKHGR